MTVVQDIAWLVAASKQQHCRQQNRHTHVQGFGTSLPCNAGQHTVCTFVIHLRFASLRHREQMIKVTYTSSTAYILSITGVYNTCLSKVMCNMPVGGRDLVFPHHENELAQSRAAYGTTACCSLPHSQSHHHNQQQEPSQSDQQAHAQTSGQQLEQQEDQAQFVRYWVHNGFVNVDSEKMSKSLGNFFTIRDVSASLPAFVACMFCTNPCLRHDAQALILAFKGFHTNVGSIL
jgi:hypothetical protein